MLRIIEENSYGCIMINLDREKDYQFYRLQDLIKDEDVYTNGLGKENEPHVTVVYGLENDSDFFKIKKDLKNFNKDIVIKGNKLKIFKDVEKNSCDCVVIEVEPSEELLEIRNVIIDNYENVQTYKNYKPHITLAYIKKGSCEELNNKEVDYEMIVDIKDFVYSPKSGETVNF